MPRRSTIPEALSGRHDALESTADEPGHAELPPTSTPLFGRQAELDRLVEMARASDGRLVTVTGAGGCGKTRLAIEAAHVLAAEFADGAAFVDLTEVGDARFVASEIVRSLGFVDVPGDDPPERLVAGLSLQQRLVVLDNLEHLSKAGPMIAAVAERCPGSVLLVTSRRRLNVHAEQTLLLRSLALPRAHDAVSPFTEPTADLASIASVAMFCDRARAVNSRFTTDERGLVTIGEICRLLDGLPLAIELTAAHTRLLPPAALRARLVEEDHRHVLGLLTRGAADAAPHRRTMRATIRWSYDLLDEPARRLLRRVAVFRGSWTLEAMEAICSDDTANDSVLDPLVDVVDLHLVNPAGDADGQPRFRMVATVRMFAGERLDSHGERDDLAARHARYFVALAHRAGRGLESRDEHRWSATLNHELPNIRQALEFLASTGRHADGLAATVVLQPYWLDQGPVREGRQWLNRFLDAGGGTEALNAVAESWLVRLAVESGDIATPVAGTDSLDRLARARAVVGAAGDACGWLRITEHMTYLLRLRGEFEQMDRLIAEALSHDGAPEHDWVRAELMLRRATTARDREDAATARGMLEETMLTSRRIGHHRSWIRAAISLAMLSEGPLAGARDDVSSSFELSQQIGDRRTAAMSAAVAGSLAALSGDLAGSVRWFRSCIDLGLGSGYSYAVNWGVMGTVVVAARAGRQREAARLQGALLPQLPAMRTLTPPAYFASYERMIAWVANSLGSEAFARECEAGGLRAWPLAVDDAKRLTDELLAEGLGATPLRTPQRRRGPRANPQLTIREQEVLGELARGHTNQRIAENLGMSPKTVMHHTGSVYRKLGVRGRAEAVAHALRSGVVA